MSCPSPTPPTLRELLQALARLDPLKAERRLEQLESLEAHLAHSRDWLAREEAHRAEVRPDGTRAAYEAWWPRATAVSNARRALRLLGVDEASLREDLEDALFEARNDEARGLRPCAACRGSGEGPRPTSDSLVEWPACAACGGRGRVLTGCP